MYRLAEEFGAKIARDFPASPQEAVRTITHVVAGKVHVAIKSLNTKSAFAH